MKSTNRHIFKKHIIYITVIVLIVTVLTVSGIGCPIAYLIGIPCPTCGVSRALYALLRFDLAAYVIYHPLALPLCYAVWLMIHAHMFRQKRILYALAGGILIANCVFYAWRIWNQL